MVAMNEVQHKASLSITENHKRIHNSVGTVHATLTSLMVYSTLFGMTISILSKWASSFIQFWVTVSQAIDNSKEALLKDTLSQSVKTKIVPKSEGEKFVSEQ